MKNKVSFDNEVYERIRETINSYTNTRVQIFKNNRRYQNGGAECQQEKETKSQKKQMKKEMQKQMKKEIQKEKKKIQKKQINSNENLFGVKNGFD